MRFCFEKGRILLFNEFRIDILIQKVYKISTKNKLFSNLYKSTYFHLNKERSVNLFLHVFEEDVKKLRK